MLDIMTGRSGRRCTSYRNSIWSTLWPIRKSFLSILFSNFIFVCKLFLNTSKRILAEGTSIRNRSITLESLTWCIRLHCWQRMAFGWVSWTSNENADQHADIRNFRGDIQMHWSVCKLDGLSCGSPNFGRLPKEVLLLFMYKKNYKKFIWLLKNLKHFIIRNRLKQTIPLTTPQTTAVVAGESDRSLSLTQFEFHCVP